MEVTEEVKFKRYLHYASEEGVFTPGCRFFFNNYTPDKLTSLSNLIASGKEDAIIDMIEEVYNAKTSVYPEAIIFALAQCVRDKRNESLKDKAYKMIEKICTSMEYLFIFFKFSFEIEPKGGTGRACRRIVTNWYLNKTALNLAEVVAFKRKYKGWTHADLINLAHIKTDDPAKGAVLRYVMKGLDSAKKKFGSVPEAEEVLTYLETVQKFRHEKSESAVARTIESYLLTVDHLNCDLLKSKEVWTALLRQMPLSALLDHFQYLSKNRMFRSVERGSRAWDLEFISCVCDALENPSKLEESGLHPSRVYVELSAYQNAARMKLELGVKHKTMAAQNPPTLSDTIVQAMTRVFRSSMTLLKPTGLKYVVGISLPLLKGRHCGFCRHMSCLNAAGLITTCLLKVEQNIDIITSRINSPTGSIVPLQLAPNSTIDDFCAIVTEAQCQLLKETHYTQIRQTGVPDVCSLFSWATKNNKKVDVFIYLSSFFQPSTNVVEDFKKYKETEGVPNTRLVICDLGKTQSVARSSTIEAADVLTISGFDHRVCRLIEVFSQGAF